MSLTGPSESRLSPPSRAPALYAVTPPSDLALCSLPRLWFLSLSSFAPAGKAVKRTPREAIAGLAQSSHPL